MTGVLLLSGGLDSAVIARIVDDVDLAVHVNYGQRAHTEEALMASATARALGLPLEYVEVGLPWWRPDPQDRTMLLPGRNAMLLSLAAAAAQARGLPSPAVFIGCNADDQENYEDCRPAFLIAMASVLGMPVYAPLLSQSKARIGALAREYGIAEWWSCYYPPSPGVVCGRCDACAGARRAQASMAAPA